jgi:hypothetical protein
MQELKEALAQIEAGLATAELDHAKLTAKIAGLVAERDALERALRRVDGASGEQTAPELTKLTKADAIVRVLQESAEPMRINEIVAALRSGGRPNENYNGVSVYLDTLLSAGRVTRVDRGLYVADRR